jgi:hypothetical protein
VVLLAVFAHHQSQWKPSNVVNELCSHRPLFFPESRSRAVLNLRAHLRRFFACSNGKKIRTPACRAVSCVYCKKIIIQCISILQTQNGVNLDSDETGLPACSENGGDYWDCKPEWRFMLAAA